MGGCPAAAGQDPLVVGTCEDGAAMATRTTVIRIDDVDGVELDGSGETVEFALDGVTYEIDLTSANAARLRSSVERYVRHGRRVGGRRTTASPGARAVTRTDPEQLKAARRWLRDHGHQVSDRGRLKGELMDLYLANAGN